MTLCSQERILRLGMHDGVGRVLRFASQVLGGPPVLAAHLKVDAACLDRWLLGLDAPPPAMFLRAVDLILNWSERQPHDVVQDLRREIAESSR